MRDGKKIAKKKKTHLAVLVNGGCLVAAIAVKVEQRLVVDLELVGALVEGANNVSLGRRDLSDGAGAGNGQHTREGNQFSLHDCVVSWD